MVASRSWPSRSVHLRPVVWNCALTHLPLRSRSELTPSVLSDASTMFTHSRLSAIICRESGSVRGMSGMGVTVISMLVRRWSRLWTASS